MQDIMSLRVSLFFWRKRKMKKWAGVSKDEKKKKEAAKASRERKKKNTAKKIDINRGPLRKKAAKAVKKLSKKYDELTGRSIKY